MSNVFYSVVFEGHPRNIKGNPFDAQSDFGRVAVLSASNLSDDADCFREALERIAAGEGNPAEIAQAAMDERDAALTENLKRGSK